MKQKTNTISEVPRAQKASPVARFANRAWSAAKFPLMVAGLAIVIGMAAARYNPSYSQKKGKAQVPIAQSDSLIASRAAGFAQAHASKAAGETIKFLEAKRIKPSSEMADTTFVRFEGRVVLNKYDIMKLETTGTTRLRSFRLYFDKPTSTVFIFEVPQSAPQME